MTNLSKSKDSGGTDKPCDPGQVTSGASLSASVKWHEVSPAVTDSGMLDCQPLAGAVTVIGRHHGFGLATHDCNLDYFPLVQIPSL